VGGILVGVSEDRDTLRAADADREYVAERLRNALNEGRLTLTEYDDRLQETYAARTYGDLKGLLSDLPEVAPAARSQVVPANPLHAPSALAPAAPPGNLTAQWLAHEWRDWLTIAAILTVIWLASGAGYYWPIWPVGVIGAIKVAQTVSGLASGEPRKRYERQVRKSQQRSVDRQKRETQRTKDRDDRD
jgi:hypothetical protein